MTMKAKIAEVKAKFSAYIRRAKSGEVITVYDRDVPVARITGISKSPLSSRPPVTHGPLSELALPPPGSYPFDPLESLLEDRRRDRLSR
jgi:prevent-host-death family protein